MTEDYYMTRGIGIHYDRYSNIKPYMHGYRFVTNFDYEELMNKYLSAIDLYKKTYGDISYIIYKDATDCLGRPVKSLRALYLSNKIKVSNFWRCFRNQDDFLTEEEMMV
jgi:hypothetical protein